MQLHQSTSLDHNQTHVHRNTPIHHVCSPFRQICLEATVAEEMDDAACRMARRCSRLQETRFDFIRALFATPFIDSHVGLRYDDLIPEENDTVQLALKRLPPKEAYDRVFRLRRAFQVMALQKFVSPGG